MNWPLKETLTSQVRLLPGCLRSGTDSQQMSQEARKRSPPLSTCHQTKCEKSFQILRLLMPPDQVWENLVFRFWGFSVSHPLSLHEGGLVHAVLVSQGREGRFHTGSAWFQILRSFLKIILNAHLTHRSTGFFIHCSSKVYERRHFKIISLRKLYYVQTKAGELWNCDHMFWGKKEKRTDLFFFDKRVVLTSRDHSLSLSKPF